MRITEEQATQIKSIAMKIFGDDSRVWLFGSRTDDDKKGGDIDLYVETHLSEDIAKKKIQMKQKLFNIFGDQKIDLIVHRLDLPTKAFYELAKKSGIRL